MFGYLEHFTIEIAFDFLVGRASRIRERVVDTGSPDTEKPVLQNRGAALQSLNSLARRGGFRSVAHQVVEVGWNLGFKGHRFL
jgi:hypothetical protein